MTKSNRQRSQIREVVLLLILMLLVFMHRPVLSEDETAENIAAGLRVMYPGVEIRRANTERWMPLAPDAEMPFGAADMLRTDETGRVLLNFAEQGDLLILPSSTVELVAFTLHSGNSLQLSIRLDGHAIQRIVSNTTFEIFRLESQNMVVIQPARLFGVWAMDDSPPVVVVAEGEARIDIAGKEFQLPAGHGLRVLPSVSLAATPLDPPFNAAQLIGKLDGCPGETQTSDKRGVNVRVGPGFDYAIVGSIPKNRAVRVMAVSEFGDWYRIQAYSGFGWMQASLVTNNCENLPVLSGIIVERNLSVWNVSPEELTRLELFYGPPGEDLWFYRGSQSEN